MTMRDERPGDIADKDEAVERRRKALRKLAVGAFVLPASMALFTRKAAAGSLPP